MLDLANAYAWIADLVGDIGEYQVAHRYRKRQIKIFEDLLIDDPQNRKIQYRWTTSAIALGYVSVELDLLEEASSLHAEAIQKSRSLELTDDSNTDWLASEYLLAILNAYIKCSEKLYYECKSLARNIREDISRSPDNLKPGFASFHVFKRLKRLEEMIAKLENSEKAK